MGSELVQNHDRCVTQYRSGDGQSLTLSAAENGAFLSDRGVNPVGESIDEFRCVRQIERGS